MFSADFAHMEYHTRTLDRTRLTSILLAVLLGLRESTHSSQNPTTFPGLERVVGFFVSTPKRDSKRVKILPGCVS